MTTFSCKKCGSIDLYIRECNSQVGLYCSDCGAWIKWLGKEERRLVELQIERNNLKINECKIDLSKVSTDDLLLEIHRRIIGE